MEQLVVMLHSVPFHFIPIPEAGMLVMVALFLEMEATPTPETPAGCFVLVLSSQGQGNIDSIGRYYVTFQAQ
jgi:hypothetical protein